MISIKNKEVEPTNLESSSALDVVDEAAALALVRQDGTDGSSCLVDDPYDDVVDVAVVGL